MAVIPLNSSRGPDASAKCEHTTRPNWTNLLAKEVANVDGFLVIRDNEVDGEVGIHRPHLVLKALHQHGTGKTISSVVGSSFENCMTKSHQSVTSLGHADDHVVDVRANRPNKSELLCKHRKQEIMSRAGGNHVSVGTPEDRQTNLASGKPCVHSDLVLRRLLELKIGMLELPLKGATGALHADLPLLDIHRHWRQSGVLVSRGSEACADTLHPRAPLYDHS